MGHSYDLERESLRGFLPLFFLLDKGRAVCQFSIESSMDKRVLLHDFREGGLRL